MSIRMNRREFISQSAALATVAAGVPPATAAADAGRLPKVPQHSLTVISGSPRERGRCYGRIFADDIREFLNREIFQLTEKSFQRDQLYRYAGECMKKIRKFSPTITDEMEGMAEGSGLRLEDLVLITSHEELTKAGVLPKAEHCTALAVGPPNTSDGNTYVGQNWDWTTRLYGVSTMLLWKRPEGPDLLAYAYPGMWVGAGLNEAGVALCWTYTEGLGIKGPAVGIPSYVLIAQMLYQPTLAEAIEEARRANHAGWFSFVLADGNGQLASVEGSPAELAVELHRGHLARHRYGTRQMTRPRDGKTLPRAKQWVALDSMLKSNRGKLNRQTLEPFFGHHESGICVCLKPDVREIPAGTIDTMLFNTTTREAFLSRGPGCEIKWKRFAFE